MRLNLPLSAIAVMGLALASCVDEEVNPLGPLTGTGAAGGGETDGRPDGDPCTADEQCRGGVCVTEEAFGWAQGYCSGLCAPGLIECEAGSECLGADDGYSLCIKTCGAPADCTGEGQTCFDLSGDGSLAVCLGGCESDAQCENACNDDAGLCVAEGEICDNAKDDDVDTLQDCEELDCASDTACVESIDAACGAALDVSEGGRFTGTTEDGTNLFAAACSDLLGSYLVGSGNPEKIFQFVAPAQGVVLFSATATKGDFDWYVRTGCEDGTTLDCLFPASQGGEPMELLVEPGDTYYVFIDGKPGDGGNAGAEYALDVTFDVQVCGDSAVVGTEQCDDGNDADDDLCTGACEVNTAVVCANVAAVTGAAVEGDTTQGMRGFEGLCGGVGAELVYRYTPEVSGVATITVTPDEVADIVLYARTSCEDELSELDCTDLRFGGGEESIEVAVTAGEPIDIFVDSYTTSASGQFTLSIAVEE